MVNIDNVTYIRLMTVDKNKILYNRVDITGAIEYVLIDNSHFIERYRSVENARTAFDDFENDGFYKMQNVEIFINKAYLKGLERNAVNKCKLDYILFNGIVQDVFETEAQCKVAYNKALTELTEELPEDNELLSISVTTPSTITSYIEGQDFIPDGMIVTAYYSNDKTFPIINYIITDGENLPANKKSVTIQYTKNGITKETTQSIFVAARVISDITITETPIKTKYVVGEKLNTSGMKIKVTYSDGFVEDITASDCIISISRNQLLTVDNTFFMATYKDKSVIQPIQVVEE